MNAPGNELSKTFMKVAGAILIASAVCTFGLGVYELATATKAAIAGGQAIPAFIGTTGVSTGAGLLGWFSYKTPDWAAAPAAAK
jgi:Na+/H+-dicarboxylate symporter